MANFKKMDDHEIIFVNKKLSLAEEKAFGEFLKSRKSKTKAKKIAGKKTQPKKKSV